MSDSFYINFCWNSQDREFISHILLSECVNLLFFIGENNAQTKRFLGFSVYISNTTNKEDGILCFRDTKYTKTTIPNPINITCPFHGRYVIYYNNRTHFPYPVGYSNKTGSDLCEVEVYGKFLLYSNFFFSCTTSFNLIFHIKVKKLIFWHVVT